MTSFTAWKTRRTRPDFPSISIHAKGVPFEGFALRLFFFFYLQKEVFPCDNGLYGLRC